MCFLILEFEHCLFSDGVSVAWHTGVRQAVQVFLTPRSAVVEETVAAGRNGLCYERLTTEWHLRALSVLFGGIWKALIASCYCKVSLACSLSQRFLPNARFELLPRAPDITAVSMGRLVDGKLGQNKTAYGLGRDPSRAKASPNAMPDSKTKREKSSKQVSTQKGLSKVRATGTPPHLLAGHYQQSIQSAHPPHAS